jgi:heat shock protein HspQ
VLFKLTELEGAVSISVTYAIGTVVKHQLYGYRGVVVSYDSSCMAGDKWYYGNKTQPKQNQPWYHLLIDESGGLSTYVAQSNLSFDRVGTPIVHPRTDSYFSCFKNGVYILKAKNLDV